MTFMISFLYDVSLNKEIYKKEKKENTMPSDPPSKYHWEIAINKEQLGRVNKN